MSAQLQEFLAPDSIAIVGASADPTKRGYKALSGLLEEGFEGVIYPINPREEEILGVKAYPSIDAIPGHADLAIVCTPARTVPGIVRQCGEAGIKGAVILASGFGETGPEGAKLEAEIMRAVEETGIRIVGPNTSGMFNLHKKVNPLGLKGVRPGKIGIISQSGNMLLSLSLEAQANGEVGFSTYVGPGNQTDISFADYLQYLGDDPETGVATLYVEGFKDGERFLEVAREVASKKPVVVYKSGSTEAGKKAAASHTGALAGSFQMTADLLRQAGVTLVSQSDEILPVAEGLSLMRHARGRRVAILADGGGQATIATDRLIEAGLQLAELTEETQARLREVLLPQASVVNPVDVAGTTDAAPAAFIEALRILGADPNVDQLFLVGMFGGYALRFAAELQEEEIKAANGMAVALRESGKPMVVHSLYTPIKPEPLMRLRRAGIPVTASIEHGVRILQALAERGDYLERSKRAAHRVHRVPNAKAQLSLANARIQTRDLLEHESRALLRQYGIKVADELIIRDEADIEKAAERFGDTPLAMKVVSKDILHKSDAGGVKLNLVGSQALREARAEILANCKAYKADAEIEGVLVTPMAKSGVEVIIGMSRDAVFGPVLMFGLGGIFVEVLKDVAFRALPLSRADARSMIEQIRARKILEGARGSDPVDKEALVDLLLRVARVIESHPEIAELDLNPVIAYPDGYAVVDARVILDKEPN